MMRLRQAARSTRPDVRLRPSLLAAGSAGVTLLSGCTRAGVLDPQGPIAAAERLILINATSIMLVVVLPVILMVFGFAWWYRASNRRAEVQPEWAHSGHIELVVWAIPAMVVILIGSVAWVGSHALDPMKKIESGVEPLRIEVVSMDWKWLFIYPDQSVASVNALVVPAGTPLEFSLTSSTVMSAFFVPQLGSQVYAMPGMATRLNLLAERPGKYPGFASHYVGKGFSDMRFVVTALDRPAFDAWLAATRASQGATLDAAAYAQLNRPSERVPPQTWRDVEAGLFGHAMSEAAPGSTAHSPKGH